MNDQTRAVLDIVDARDLIDLASALIRIPSFKTEETAVALFVDRFFRERGYGVDLQEIEPGRLQTIATLRGAGSGVSLMLNGHTDINALTRRWRRDPWTPSLGLAKLWIAVAHSDRGGRGRDEARGEPPELSKSAGQRSQHTGSPNVNVVPVEVTTSSAGK